MRFSGPNFIIGTTFGYIFRLRVPSDLQDRIGLTEIRRSLRTRSRRKAKLLARSIAARIHPLFETLRNGNMPLTPDQIKALIDGYIAEALDQSETERAKSTAMTVRQLHDRKRALQDELGMAEQDLVLGINTLSEPDLEALLERESLEIDATDRARLLREILKARVDLWRHELARTDGDYRPPEGLFYPQATAPAPAPAVSAPAAGASSKISKSTSLKAAIEQYFDEMTRATRWAARTEIEYRNAYSLAERFFRPSTPLTAIDAASCREYKTILMTLPRNFLRVKKYDGMTLKEGAALGVKETLSGSAINRYLGCLGQLLEWAKGQGYIASNPARGLKLPRTKRPREQRKPFSDDDLKALFSSEEYKNGTFRHEWMHWLPLLALFTGCRLEEICQSHLADYRPIDGVLVLDIAPGHEKRLKTESSRRVVPLHPFLLNDLGFKHWLDKLRADGHEGRIFPELKKIQHNFGHYAGRWFSKYKTQRGIDDKRKSFHSFRHRFSDELKQTGVPVAMLDELSGHVAAGESMGRYTEPFSPRLLLEKAISKLDFAAVLSEVKPFR